MSAIAISPPPLENKAKKALKEPVNAMLLHWTSLKTYFPQCGMPFSSQNQFGGVKNHFPGKNGEIMSILVIFQSKAYENMHLNPVKPINWTS